MTALAVAAAGAAGALARYALGGWIARRSASGLPLETLVINVSGSLALGLVFVLLTERIVVHPSLRTSITVGFLGAYTTFSTFSLETLRLIEDGAVALAVTNVAASVIAGLVAVYLGVVIARAL